MLNFGQQCESTLYRLRSVLFLEVVLSQKTLNNIESMLFQLYNFCSILIKCCVDILCMQGTLFYSIYPVREKMYLPCQKREEG